MKKLILLHCLLGWLLPQSWAQVELEGELFVPNPHFRFWDGTHLLYHKKGKLLVYHSEDKRSEEIPAKTLDGLKLNNGFYFREIADGKLQLWHLDSANYVLEEGFDWVGTWFHGVVVARTVVTSPELGVAYTWIDDTGQVLAKHDLGAFRAALGMSARYSQALENMTQVYTDGLLPVYHPETQRYGYYDLDLNRVVEHLYTDAAPFFEGLAAVKNQEGFWGYIDKQGREVIPFRFSVQPGRFSDGFAWVRATTGKLGFIDRSGELKIPTNYSDVSLFYKGFSLVRQSFGKYQWRLIDSNGKEREIPCESCFPVETSPASYLEKGYFPHGTLVNMVDNGLGVFGYGNKSMVISSEGETLASLRDGKIYDFVNGTFVSYENNPIFRNYLPKRGIQNLEGTFLILMKSDQF